jgi:hypothetical protein
MNTSRALRLIALFVLLSSISDAQTIEGTWVGGIQGLPLVFEISATETGYSARMQSPKQSKQFITVDLITFEEKVLTLKLNQFQINYQGQLNGEIILGTFTQGGASFPMDLVKKEFNEADLRRKQEPIVPFSYQVEEITFKNKAAAGILLSGTLTTPPGIKKPPVVILISGSGPQDRNEEFANHKPFLVIADHLTKNGIAVLRYDDRGVGKSQGHHDSATSEDFATDVAAAVQFLQGRDDIDQHKIGLIGHSEGGLIAPMVIAQHPDQIAFFVSLAGPGLRGDQVLIPQMEKAAQLAGSSKEDVTWGTQLMEDLFEIINNSTSLSTEDLSQLLMQSMAVITANATPEQLANYPKETQAAIAQQFSSNWMRYFLTHDPTKDLQQVHVPTLLLNGSLDFQVIPEINLPAMEKKIKSNGNTDVTTVELEQLNHLFQTAITGSSTEYATLEETFAPVALKTISDWINERF